MNYSRTLNLMIAAIVSLVVIIVLVIFTRTAKKPHPYYGGADISDTYAPYSPWDRAR